MGMRSFRCRVRDFPGITVQRIDEQGSAGRRELGARAIDKVTLWNKPVAKACPSCGAPFLLEKTTKKLGTRLICGKEGCGYTEQVEADGADAPGVERPEPVEVG